MKQNTRIQLENILIGALCALSLVLFVLSFLPGLGLANRVSVFLEMGAYRDFPGKGDFSSGGVWRRGR